MAVDNRPFKSKEQDGQGNEVIIRDQQLVEQDTATTMPAGTCFQTLDVDGRPVKIPKDNMLNLIVEGLGIIFNGQTDQQTVTKVPTLNGNNFGASTVATLASVLGAIRGIGMLSENDSYDDLLPGIYMGNPFPSRQPCEWGILLVMTIEVARVDVIFENNKVTPGIWYRLKWGSTWEVGWNKIS